MSKKDQYVRMRPAPDEDTRSMLAPMLVAFGGEVVKIDDTGNIAILKFASVKAANDFKLADYEFEMVPNPNAPPSRPDTPPMSSTPPTPESANKENAGQNRDGEGGGRDFSTDKSSVHPGADLTTKEPSLTEMYRVRDSGGVQRSTGRVKLDDGDMVYIMFNANVLAPFVCGVLLLICCGALFEII